MTGNVYFFYLTYNLQTSSIIKTVVYDTSCKCTPLIDQLFEFKSHIYLGLVVPTLKERLSQQND